MTEPNLAIPHFSTMMTMTAEAPDTNIIALPVRQTQPLAVQEKPLVVGIPYVFPDEPEFQAWVDQMIAYSYTTSKGGYAPGLSDPIKRELQRIKKERR